LACARLFPAPLLQRRRIGILRRKNTCPYGGQISLNKGQSESAITKGPQLIRHVLGFMGQTSPEPVEGAFFCVSAQHERVDSLPFLNRTISILSRTLHGSRPVISAPDERQPRSAGRGSGKNFFPAGPAPHSCLAISAETTASPSVGERPGVAGMGKAMTLVGLRRY
jgi:hypothetical protein